MQNRGAVGRRTFLRSRGTPDRLLVVFSDIEMGSGGPLDDFPHSRHLGDLLLSYTFPSYDGLAIDLVFNGDTFDLLKTPFQGRYPSLITEAIALDKMDQIAGAHGPFFEALRIFLGRTGKRGAVHFLPGNHDTELAFPALQRRIRQLIGDEERVNFPGLAMELGRVHIEHGSQFDPLFQVDPQRPFVERAGEPVLNLAWGTVALLDVAMPLHPLLYHHERLKPRRRVLELIPEIRELLTTSFWNYWVKDYLRDFFRGTDPLKQISWTMLKEAVLRTASGDPDVTTGTSLQQRMIEHDDFDLYLIGHEHEPGLWNLGLRRVIRTGAMRDEFMISDGEVQTPLPKSYAEVWMAGDEPVRSHLVEREMPVRSLEQMPASLFEVVPTLRRMLASPEQRRDQLAAQKAQEAQESKVK